MTRPWFEVDKQGLARILRRRGLEFMAYELIANAWDSQATKVNVTLEAVPNRPLAILTVEDDDPNGFANIAHAFTMFADSSRRDNPEQRGRFNIGEKLVLACADEATIHTTTTGLRFDREGRHTLRKHTDTGSVIKVWFKATKAEVTDMLDKLQYLIPPIPTAVNGQAVNTPEALATFSTTLETVLPDDEGILRHRQRKTQVNVYPSLDGTTWLYELGIPVVESGDTFSYDVQQKVPVSLERDNVPPSYLRRLRVNALNALHDLVPTESANDSWVRDALADPDVTSEAVRDMVTKRFGDKVVAYDPSDHEANSLAFSQGYVVVHGRQLSAAEWDNIKRDDAIKPAGQVTPSPKPYDPNGKPLRTLPEELWTDGMRDIVQYAKRLYKALLGHDVGVRIANDFGLVAGATYGKGGPLTLNVSRLGKRWFENGITDEVVSLLIHEAGHEYCGDHLSAEYHKALCRLGAKMRNLKHLETERA